MIPLIIADAEKDLQVIKVSVDDKTKRHLENLGILKGSVIYIISKTNKNVILKVKDGRLAIDENLASKIYVS